MFAEWTFIGVNAVVQGCCQLIWHSSTEEQGRQFTLNSSALVFGDCTHVCRVDLHRCKCSGTNLLSADLAQQHRRTRHAVYCKHSSSALVFGDCTPVCRMDLHRCKRSGTRLLSAAWHSSTEEQGRQFTLNSSSALVIGDCTPICRVDLQRF